MTATTAPARPADAPSGAPAGPADRTGAAPGAGATPPTTTGAGWALAAELTLAAVTLAGVAGLVRLFEQTSFLVPVMVAGVAAHALAALGRRLGWGAPGITIAGIIGLALAASWLVLPDTLALGVPTTETWSAARAELSAAWETFRTVLAPAPVETGFTLACVIAVWLVALVADAAAFRLRAPVEAVVPATTIFVFGAALGADRHRVLVTCLFLAAVLAHALAQRGRRQAAVPTWLGGRARAGNHALLRSGAVLAAVAVAASALVGPRLPGSDDDAIIPWRASDRDSPGSRVTISPLVDIRTRIVNQSNLEVFRVESTERAYWRLTSLENFDGRIWSSRGSYRPAGEVLPEPEPALPETARVVQEFEIAALGSIWLPAAYRPARLRSDGPVRYEPDSGSLLTEDLTSDGLTYLVESAIPQLDGGQLRNVPAQAPASLIETYLALPDGFSPRVRAEAESIVADAPSQYDKALALQNHLRDNFEYDLEVPPGHGDNEIERFLFETRRGYCEQFAGSFAAMARAVALPARVAVGFTPGELGTDGRYSVRGGNGHAWPEVYLEGYGWVAFEPTPGRGIPNAENYTGVPEQQAAIDDPSVATTLPPVEEPQLPEPPEPDAEVAPVPDPTAPGGGEPDAEAGAVPAWMTRLATIVVAALAVAGIWLGGIAALTRVRRDRRRADARDNAERVGVAWLEIREALSRAGVTMRAWETDDEYARRAAERTGIDAGLLRGVAGVAAAAAYGPGDLDDRLAAQVSGAVTEVEQAVADGADWHRRIRWAVDPRPLLPRPGGQRRVVSEATA